MPVIGTFRRDAWPRVATLATAHEQETLAGLEAVVEHAILERAAFIELTLARDQVAARFVFESEAKVFVLNDALRERTRASIASLATGASASRFFSDYTTRRFVARHPRGQLDVLVVRQPDAVGDHVAVWIRAPSRPLRSISELGFAGATEVALVRSLSVRSGVIVFVGQRASGLTTTSYAVMQALVRAGRTPIVSIEDPIEEELEGVEQVAVDAKIGLSASHLIEAGACTRPAVVSCGVLVDRTSMDACFAHARAGRLVLAIVWGQRPTDAVTRLADAGVSADALSHLVAAFAQRLVDGKVIAEHVAYH
jgi:hypothetical protein